MFSYLLLLPVYFWVRIKRVDIVLHNNFPQILRCNHRIFLTKVICYIAWFIFQCRNQIFLIKQLFVILLVELFDATIDYFQWNVICYVVCLFVGTTNTCGRCIPELFPTNVSMLQSDISNETVIPFKKKTCYWYLIPILHRCEFGIYQRFYQCNQAETVTFHILLYSTHARCPFLKASLGIETTMAFTDVLLCLSSMATKNFIVLRI